MLSGTETVISGDNSSGLRKLQLNCLTRITIFTFGEKKKLRDSFSEMAPENVREEQKTYA